VPTESWSEADGTMISCAAMKLNDPDTMTLHDVEQKLMTAPSESSDSSSSSSSPPPSLRIAPVTAACHFAPRPNTCLIPTA
jgi:hypothetical protein